MEKAIKGRFNDEILAMAASTIGLNSNSLEYLGGFHSFVYRGKYKDKDIVLKITHSSHRDIELIESEIEFIQHLADSSVSVANALLFPCGNYTKIIDNEDSYFIVSMFEFSNGRRAKIAEESVEFYRTLGETVGRVHKISKYYKPQKSLRYDWKEKNYLRQFKLNVPEELTLIHSRFDSIISSVEKLKKSKDTFGLIHGDIYPGNYLNDGGHVTLIDFDQCEYSWFVSDVAMPLFYETPIPWVVGQERRHKIALRFYNNFMEGYHKINTIDTYWLKQIPLFINLRQLSVISAIYRSYDFNNYDNWKQWDKEALKFYKENLENDNNYLNIEF